MSEYQYKMVNGELVPLTADEIAELEARDQSAPPPITQIAPDQGVRANQRLDAGIAAAQPAVDDAQQASNRVQLARTTEDQLAALQVQVDALTKAMSDMLVAQTGPTPREVN